jgi:hypothetical protein
MVTRDHEVTLGVKIIKVNLELTEVSYFVVKMTIIEISKNFSS